MNIIKNNPYTRPSKEIAKIILTAAESNVPVVLRSEITDAIQAAIDGFFTCKNVKEYNQVFFNCYLACGRIPMNPETGVLCTTTACTKLPTGISGEDRTILMSVKKFADAMRNKMKKGGLNKGAQK